MSFSLDGTNEFAVVGSILNNTKLTEYQIQKRKFLYIEGLIRFLELYAQNEIGNVEVDIEKIALWVNSPSFENVDIYRIKNIESVYNMLSTELIDYNIPLYRFLKLSKYQFEICEKEHFDQIQQSFAKDCEKYPCLKCIWYENSETAFGTLSKCKLPKEKITGEMMTHRQGYHDITLKKNRTCKYCTTAEGKDEFIRKYITNNKKIWSNYDRCSIKNDIEELYQEWVNKVNCLDNSYIPQYIPNDLHVSLTEKTDWVEDFCRVFGNKKGKNEMKTNLRFAIFLETMIKFVEIYAQTEIGSDYIADISSIAKYVSNYSTKLDFASRDEFYKYLENNILDNSTFINKFIKRKDI